MKKVLRLKVFGLVFVFLFTAVLADFNSSYAARERKTATQSGIKDRGQAAKERQVARWESLTPEQQEYLKEEAKVTTKDAAITGQEYWDSLSAEEQRQAIDRSKEGVEKGRRRWRSLPE
jgi:hypothetical protein